VEKKELSEIARIIPYCFLGIMGLIYASGFLVVTTHLEALGIRDLGSEVWKSRYVYIGVFSLVFPAMIVSTFYVFFVYIFSPQSKLDTQSQLHEALVGKRILWVPTLRKDVESSTTGVRGLWVGALQETEQIARWVAGNGVWVVNSDGQGRISKVILLVVSLLTVVSLELTFYAFAMFGRLVLPKQGVVTSPLVWMLVIGMAGLFFVRVRDFADMKKGWRFSEQIWKRKTFWFWSATFWRIVALLVVWMCSICNLAFGGVDVWTFIKEIWCRLIAVLHSGVDFRTFINEIEKYRLVALSHGGVDYWTYITEICEHRLAALLLMFACWISIGTYVIVLKRSAVAGRPAGERALAWLLCASVSGPMYFLSLIAFAHSLFPYIPATRGGGDYTSTHMATIWFKSPDNTPFAPQLSWRFGGVMEETSATVYVMEQGNWKPCEWRKRTVIPPPPMAISRDQIIMIQYSLEHSADCP
jgi:hypothetical protein